MKRTTKIGNRNVKVVRKYYNAVTGVLVELTRKMRIDGTIGYYTVVTYDGRRNHKIMGGAGIDRAWLLYKAAIGRY